MKLHKPGLRAAGNHPILIGHRATGEPIFLAAGGNGVSAAPDDDAAERALFGERDDEDDDDPDGDDDDPDDGEDSGYTPPDESTWAQMQRDLAAQRAANSQGGRLARALRDQGLTLEEAYAKLGLDPKTGKVVAKSEGADDAPADEPAGKPEGEPEKPTGMALEDFRKAVNTEAERQVAREVAKTEQRYLGPLKALAVKSALHDAEWSGKDIGRVLKMIADDDIEVTEDGDVVGVVEQIEAIKEEFPEWFQRRPQRREPRSAADLDGGERRAPTKTLSWKEKAVARLEGQARR